MFPLLNGPSSQLAAPSGGASPARCAPQFPPPPPRLCQPHLRQGAAAGSAGSTCRASAACWWSGRRGGLGRDGDGGPAAGGVDGQSTPGHAAAVVGREASARWKPRVIAAQRDSATTRCAGWGGESGGERHRPDVEERVGIIKAPASPPPLPSEPRTGGESTRSALRWARRVTVMTGAGG